MLTRSGTLVTGWTAVLLAAGIATGYPELVALGLTAGAAVLLALGWVLRRPRVTASREIRPQRVTEGMPACAVLTVRNTGPRRSPPLLVDEVVGDTRVSVSVPGLGPHEEHRTTYPIPTGRRGRYPVEPLVVGRTDPLRLCRRGHRCTEPSVLYVHPRVHRLTASRPGTAPDPNEESQASPLSPNGLAFHSLRQYASGDDWRQVHWNSSAKTGTLMVRQNVMSSEPRHLVVLDTYGDGYTDKAFEHAVRAAGTLCVAFAAGGARVTLRTTGGRVAAEPPTGWSAPPAVAALDLLADVDRSFSDPGLPALGRLDPGGDEVVLTVVTGRVDRAQLAVLPAVRGRYLAVHLIQVRERPVRTRVPLPGVQAASIRTSDELAAAWAQVNAG